MHSCMKALNTPAHLSVMDSSSEKKKFLLEEYDGAEIEEKKESVDWKVQIQGWRLHLIN